MDEATTTAGWLVKAGPTGVLALVVVALSLVVRHLWAELKSARIERDKLYETMLADARANTASLLAMNDRVHVATERMADLFELEKQGRPNR